MKPRIIELAQTLGVKPDPAGNMFITNGREFNDLERFAELIIEECSQIAGDNGQRIREHFGVEL